MEDILEVYQRPLDPDQPLICMDEANRQLIEQVRAPIAPEPGQPERFDSEYKRNGTANVFMFCEPLRGKRHVRIAHQRTRRDWALLIRELVDDIYPQARKITLVMDNLNTHCGAALYETFEPAEARRLLSKLEMHYTPKHGSWLNIAEIELSVLHRQCLNRRIATREILKEQTHAWQTERNNDPTPVDWRFTTNDARIKLKRLYPRPQTT